MSYDSDNENNIHLELPLPPYGDVDNSETFSNRAEDALLALVNGDTLTGELRHYSPNEHSIAFFALKDSTLRDIPLTDIKSIELNQSRQFNPDHKLGNQGDIQLQNERQQYELDFVDGSSAIGETLGSVSDPNGIHLFIAQAFYTYHHLFVPFTALKSHNIGPKLGTVLVKQQSVTPDELEQGLEVQEDLRTRKLGEYLTEHEIIEQEELQKALERQAEMPNIRLGEALIQEGVISEQQLDEALSAQKEDRSKQLGEILLDMGLVTQESLNKSLASKLGIPYVNVRKFQIDTAMMDLIPESLARKHMVMPLCMAGKKIVVAMANPTVVKPLEDLRFHTKKYVEPAIALDEDIEWAINQYYGLTIGSLAAELADDDDDDISTAEDFHQDEISESDNTLVRLVNKMILDAHEQGASDIHIEPYPGKNKTIIRFRKDGSLIPYVELSPAYRFSLVSRIKIMCNLDISERRKPQDGKIDFRKFGPAKIELRVATIPTTGGLEDVVMRLLANGKPVPLSKLNLQPPYLREIEKIASQPHGLFLVCGPTGSGKTTTLHSILGSINTPERKIWTAEDPVEITQPGLRQVQVNEKINLNFANAMRAFLRADPDVIMVGEMRDEDTTKIGIEASLTGHLVFSTLHTNSAPESVVRLLDMGMDPYNFADALLGILAQRLTKRLCTACRISYVPDEDELITLCDEYFGETVYMDERTDSSDNARNDKIRQWKKEFGNEQGEITLYRAHEEGCEHCRNTGYNGRVGIHELLVATPLVKKLIQEHSTIAEIQIMAVTEGMETLRQDGIRKVLQGLTDIQQVRAVCVK